MNKVKILIIAFYFSANIFGQSEIQDWCQLELFIGIEGISNTTDSVKFTMLNLNDTNNDVYYPPITAYNSFVGNTPIDKSPRYNWFGFERSGTNCGPNNNDNPVIRPGGTVMEKYSNSLYKIIAEYFDSYNNKTFMQFYFYLDFRDNRYPDYSPPTNGHSTDLWLKYYASFDSNSFAYSPSSPGFGDSNGNGLYEEPFVYAGWTQIPKGEILTIWDIKKGGTSNPGYPLTTQSMWDNGLVIIKDDIHPTLIWCAYPNREPDNYEIYRAITFSTNPKFRTYTQVATISSTIFNWTDYNISLGSGQYIYYYVTAQFGYHGYSSNVEMVTGGMTKQLPPPVMLKVNTGRKIFQHPLSLF